MRTTDSLLRILLLPVLCGACIRAPLVAQRSGGGGSVDSILSAFERDARERVSPSRARSELMQVLRLSPSSARRDSILDGLRRLALESEDVNVQRYSTSYLGDAGGMVAGSSVVAHLRRIYQVRPVVRLTVLDKMPLQLDRSAAVAFLRSVAAGPDLNGPDPVHGHFSNGDPRTEALARLSEMGEDGAAALRAMHRSGEARSPQARIILDDMARRGFPVRDLRRALSQQ
jgi:hypothetical protein